MAKNSYFDITPNMWQMAAALSAGATPDTEQMREIRDQALYAEQDLDWEMFDPEAWAQDFNQAFPNAGPMDASRLRGYVGELPQQSVTRQSIVASLEYAKQRALGNLAEPGRERLYQHYSQFQDTPAEIEQRIQQGVNAGNISDPGNLQEVDQFLAQQYAPWSSQAYRYENQDGKRIKQELTFGEQRWMPPGALARNQSVMQTPQDHDLAGDLEAGRPLRAYRGEGPFFQAEDVLRNSMAPPGDRPGTRLTTRDFTDPNQAAKFAKEMQRFSDVYTAHGYRVGGQDITAESPIVENAAIAQRSRGFVSPVAFTTVDIFPEGMNLQAETGRKIVNRMQRHADYQAGRQFDFVEQGTTWDLEAGDKVIPYEGADPLRWTGGGKVRFAGQKLVNRETSGGKIVPSWRMTFERIVPEAQAHVEEKVGPFKHQIGLVSPEHMQQLYGNQEVNGTPASEYAYSYMKYPLYAANMYYKANPAEAANVLGMDQGDFEGFDWGADEARTRKLYEHYRDVVLPRDTRMVQHKRVIHPDERRMWDDNLIADQRMLEGGQMEITTVPIPTVYHQNYFRQYRADYRGRSERVSTETLHAIEQQDPVTAEQLRQRGARENQSVADFITSAAASSGAIQPVNAVKADRDWLAAKVEEARARSLEAQGIEDTAQISDRVFAKQLGDVMREDEQFAESNLILGMRGANPVVATSPASMARARSGGQFSDEEYSRLHGAFARTVMAAASGDSEQFASAADTFVELQNTAASSESMRKADRSTASGGMAMYRITTAAEDLPANLIAVPGEKIARAYGIRRGAEGSEERAKYNIFMDQLNAGEFEGAAYLDRNPTSGSRTYESPVRVMSHERYREQGGTSRNEASILASPSVLESSGSDADGDALNAILAGRAVWDPESGRWNRALPKGVNVATSEEIAQRSEIITSQLKRGSLKRVIEDPALIQEDWHKSVFNPDNLYSIGEEGVWRASVLRQRMGYNIGTVYNTTKLISDVAQGYGFGGTTRQGAEDFFKRAYGLAQTPKELDPTSQGLLDLMARTSDRGGVSSTAASSSGEWGFDPHKVGPDQIYEAALKTLAKNEGGLTKSQLSAWIPEGEADHFVAMSEQYKTAGPTERSKMLGEWRRGAIERINAQSPNSVTSSAGLAMRSPGGMSLMARVLKRAQDQYAEGKREEAPSSVSWRVSGAEFQRLQDVNLAYEVNRKQDVDAAAMLQLRAQGQELYERTGIFNKGAASISVAAAGQAINMPTMQAEVIPQQTAAVQQQAMDLRITDASIGGLPDVQFEPGGVMTLSEPIRSTPFGQAAAGGTPPSSGGGDDDEPPSPPPTVGPEPEDEREKKPQGFDVQTIRELMKARSGPMSMSIAASTISNANASPAEKAQMLRAAYRGGLLQQQFFKMSPEGSVQSWSSPITMGPAPEAVGFLQGALYDSEGNLDTAQVGRYTDILERMDAGELPTSAAEQRTFSLALKTAQNYNKLRGKAGQIGQFRGFVDELENSMREDLKEKGYDTDAIDNEVRQTLGGLQSDLYDAEQASKAPINDLEDSSLDQFVSKSGIYDRFSKMQAGLSYASTARNATKSQDEIVADFAGAVKRASENLDQLSSSSSTLTEVQKEQLRTAVGEDLTGAYKDAMGGLTSTLGSSYAAASAMQGSDAFTSYKGLVADEFSPKFGEVAFDAARRMMSPFSMQRAMMRRAWMATGGPTFEQFIPAAVQQDAAISGVSTTMGGYAARTGGLAYERMSQQARLRSGAAQAGRLAYHAYGPYMDMLRGPAIQAGRAVLGPAVGAGAMVGIGSHFIGGALANVGGATGVFGAGLAGLAMPLAVGTAGFALAGATNNLLEGQVDSNVANQLAISNLRQQKRRGNTWSAIKFGVLGLEASPRQGANWFNFLEKRDYMHEMAEAGDALRAMPFDQLSGEQRSAILSEQATRFQGEIPGFEAYTPEQIASGMASMAQYSPDIEWTEDTFNTRDFRRELKRVLDTGDTAGAYSNLASALGANYAGAEREMQQHFNELGLTTERKGALMQGAAQWSFMGERTGLGWKGAVNLAQRYGPLSSRGMASMQSFLSGDARWLTMAETGQIDTELPQEIEEMILGNSNLPRLEAGTMLPMGTTTGFSNLFSNLSQEHLGLLGSGSSRIGSRMAGILSTGGDLGTSTVSGIVKSELGSWAQGWDGESMWDLQDTYRSHMRGLQAAKRGIQWDSLRFKYGSGPYNTIEDLGGTYARQRAIKHSQRDLGYVTQEGGEFTNLLGETVNFTGAFNFRRMSIEAQYGNALAGMGLQEDMMERRRAWQLQQRGWKRQDMATNIERGRIGFEYQRQDMARTEQRAGVQYGWQVEDFSRREASFGLQMQQTQMQRAWQTQDFARQRGISEMQFGWQMEDFDESIRFATGRQRKRLIRQRERAVTMQNVEDEGMDIREQRAEELNKLEDKRFSLQEEGMKAQFERLEQRREWQTEDFDTQKQRFEEKIQWQEQDWDKQLERFEERVKFEDDIYDLQRRNLEQRRSSLESNHALQLAQLDEAIRKYREQKKIAAETERVQDDIDLKRAQQLKAELGVASAMAAAQTSWADLEETLNRAKELKDTYVLQEFMDILDKIERIANSSDTGYDYQ